MKPAAGVKGFPGRRLWLALGLGLAGACGPALAETDADLVLRIDYALSSLQGLASSIPYGGLDDAGLARNIGCPAQSCEQLALAVDDQLHLVPARPSFFPGALPAAMLQTQHGGQAPGTNRIMAETGVQAVAGKWNPGPGRMPEGVLPFSSGAHPGGSLGSFIYPYDAGCGSCQVNGSASFIRQSR